MSSKPRVCIIGAGTAGLCALKNSLEHNFECVAYEQGSAIGGTWVYSENTNAEYEDDIQSSMYEGLRTNLPKEVMGYPDFQYPESLKESFVSSNEVLKFLQSYAEHFQLLPYIKFQHEVIRVRPTNNITNNKWEIYVWNKQNNQYDFVFYDFIFICNGHYTAPLYPKIDGMDIYKGKQLHSHLYRKPNMFKDEIVLIIGAGPSGMDITNHIRQHAKHVFLSHHTDPVPSTDFMNNVTQKSDVESFTETGAIFKDGTTETFSTIIFCTGFTYSFPFLSSDCELRVDDNFVYPLYKHCININYPTMAVIGLPFYVCPSQLFDLQIRFALKFFSGERKFQSRKEMMTELDKDMEERKKSGLTKRQAHQMGEKQFDYYKDLSETAGIENIKPVIGKIMKDCSRKYIYELNSYRNNCFKVIDDNTFVKYDCTSISS